MIQWNFYIINLRRYLVYPELLNDCFGRNQEWDDLVIRLVIIINLKAFQYLVVSQ